MVFSPSETYEVYSLDSYDYLTAYSKCNTNSEKFVDFFDIHV